MKKKEIARIKKGISAAEQDQGCWAYYSDFQIILIESFRYALLREWTGATIDCANRIIDHWDDINRYFQEQIKRDVRSAIETKQLKEADSIGAWEKVLKLKIKENEI